MSRPILCAGVVVADHLCTPISHLPAAGELVKADELILAIGGCASNAAMDLAKLEVPAAICGKVGDDVFGRFVAETLRGAGVDTEGLLVDPERATSQSLIINVKGQDRRFVHSFGANGGLCVDDIAKALASGTPPRVLYVGGFFILPGLDPQALADLFASYRAKGTLVVLDVAVPGKGYYVPHLQAVLPHVDAFLPNTDEAEVILGETDPVRQAEAFAAMGARRVVITLGERGSVSVSDTLRARLGAFPVDFVDGTGGGDAFDAGYIAGLIDGRDEVGCLTLASALGASCVRAVGTTAGVFTRAEANAYLARHTLPIDTF